MPPSAPDIATVVLPRLDARYPDARYELDWSTPLQLLVATILAAQCTDERVNKVTPALFARYPDAQAFAEADTAELEELIKTTGTYKQKARSIQGACRGIVERFGGEVPQTLEQLVTLPGIARKSANVVLNNAWGIASGIIVDTHVQRVSQRMGLTRNDKPEAIERDLMKLVPQPRWVRFGPAMVLHGRYTCTARAPKCDECMFQTECPRIDV